LSTRFTQHCAADGEPAVAHEALAADRQAWGRASREPPAEDQERSPEPHAADPPVLERQQAALLDLLRRAGGAPVSYAQLHDEGIGFPASVVSELELAGVGVERCDLRKRGTRRLAGVRLDPSCEPLETPTESSVLDRRDARAGVARAARTLADRVAKASSPVTGLLAGGVAAALLLIALSGGGRTLHAPRPHRRLTSAVSASARSRVPSASEAGGAVGRGALPTPHAVPVPVSPARAAQLDEQGHEMLERGRYGEAIAMLDKTLAATGETVRDCLQPASEACLTYAYALYDLGRALRLDGDPADAVPVLQRRLQIENQRATVQAQLELALAQKI